MRGQAQPCWTCSQCSVNGAWSARGTPGRFAYTLRPVTAVLRARLLWFSCPPGQGSSSCSAPGPSPTSLRAQLPTEASGWELPLALPGARVTTATPASPGKEEMAPPLCHVPLRQRRRNERTTENVQVFVTTSTDLVTS